MDKLLILFIIALLVEALVETIRMTFQNGKLVLERLIALAVGILVAIVTNTDLLKLVGIEVSIKIIGLILTGILISRGANFIHDLLTKLEPKPAGGTIINPGTKPK